MHQAYTSFHANVVRHMWDRQVVPYKLEHALHICLYQPDKSAAAEHCIETGHKIIFYETTVPARTSGYMEHLVKEAIEIQLHSTSFNRDNGYMLSRAWYPLTNML
jgi:hypothetical protein